MNAVAYSTLTLTLMLTSRPPIINGQSSLARATAMPKANRTEFKRVLTGQLSELHSQLLQLQRSSNQTNRGDAAFSGSLNQVAQKVDAMLLSAMPGFVGETIDIVQNAHPAWNLGSAFAGVSDYGLINTIHKATEHMKEAEQSFPNSFMKSLGTLEKINHEFSPSATDFESTKTYRGCRDAFLHGENKNGVYTIQVNRQPRFRAWCDFDDNGAWTVIQRRFDGNVDFSRSWSSYVNGFGSLWGEYWLGLRAIHQLSQTGVTLSMYMENQDRHGYWMNYSSFRIAGADDKYRLRVSGYNGSINDALGYHNGRQFATLDKIDDINCVSSASVGWWYNSCWRILPNGRYEGSGLSTDVFMSVAFNSWQRLTTFVMRIGA